MEVSESELSEREKEGVGCNCKERGTSRVDGQTVVRRGSGKRETRRPRICSTSCCLFFIVAAGAGVGCSLRGSKRRRVVLYV